MPFQILFGEDEHTAEEGPYSRLMKTRKWLYITAGASLALQYGLYSEKAFKDAVKVLELPVWVADQATVVALFYLTAQYLLLAWQLAFTYDLVIRDRLADRREVALANLRERLGSAQEGFAHAVDGLERMEKLTRYARSKDQDAIWDAKLKTLTSQEIQYAKEMASITRDIDRFYFDHSGNRKPFRIAEYTIDAFRVLPPALFACFVLLKYLTGLL